jgi:sterol desaturase/sphingolipid hydroxylase (fatty acid hydroxylase superfamily)
MLAQDIPQDLSSYDDKFHGQIHFNAKLASKINNFQTMVNYPIKMIKKETDVAIRGVATAFNTYGHEIETILDADVLVMYGVVFGMVFSAKYMYGDVAWSSLVEKHGDFTLVVLVSIVLSISSYWIPALLWTFAENQWDMDKYKIQPNRHITREDYIKCFKVVVRNHLVVNIPLHFVFYFLSIQFGYSLTGQLPDGLVYFRDMAVFLVIEESWYFFTHWYIHLRINGRALHSNARAYELIHKKHHEFVAPTAMAGQYATILEQLIVNILPIMIGPLFMKSHIVTFWSWILMATYSNVRSHSGHGLPFSKAPLFHDFHHR